MPVGGGPRFFISMLAAQGGGLRSTRIVLLLRRVHTDERLHSTSPPGMASSGSPEHQAGVLGSRLYSLGRPESSCSAFGDRRDRDGRLAKVPIRDPHVREAALRILGHLDVTRVPLEQRQAPTRFS